MGGTGNNGASAILRVSLSPQKDGGPIDLGLIHEEGGQFGSFIQAKGQDPNRKRVQGAQVTDFFDLQQPPNNFYHPKGRRSGRFVNNNNPMK
jgi:hypothetical protein